MNDCTHRDIIAFYDLGTSDPVLFWSCHDCKRRFYPACADCVDVGHRSGADCNRKSPEPESAETSRLGGSQ